MTIREMTPKDTAQAAAIEAAVFSQPWSRRAFLESLANEGTCFLTAEEDGAVVGYAGMYLAFDEGEIVNVAVAETFRGRGIGKALLREILARACARGVTRVVLEVRGSNLPAIRLYGQAGFQKIGVRKGFYDFPKEDADIMMWKLEP